MQNIIIIKIQQVLAISSFFMTLLYDVIVKMFNIVGRNYVTFTDFFSSKHLITIDFKLLLLRQHTFQMIFMRHFYIYLISCRDKFKSKKKSKILTTAIIYSVETLSILYDTESFTHL